MLAVGEAIGQKEKRVKADLSDIRIKPEAEYVIYDVSRDELKKDPNFTGDHKSASLKRDAAKDVQQKTNTAADDTKKNTNARQ